MIMNHPSGFQYVLPKREDTHGYSRIPLDNRPVSRKSLLTLRGFQHHVTTPKAPFQSQKTRFKGVGSNSPITPVSFGTAARVRRRSQKAAEALRPLFRTGGLPAGGNRGAETFWGGHTDNPGGGRARPI